MGIGFAQPFPLISNITAGASPDCFWLLRTQRLKQQSQELMSLDMFPVPVGLHRGAFGVGVGSLSHGHHYPSYS